MQATIRESEFIQPATYDESAPWIYFKSHFESVALSNLRRFSRHRIHIDGYGVVPSTNIFDQMLYNALLESTSDPFVIFEVMTVCYRGLKDRPHT